MASIELHEAARYGNVEVMRVLLSKLPKGYDISTKNDKGFTPFINAIYHDHI